MSYSAGYAVGIALYLVIRPMHLRYYRDKRQALRRRIWYREERERRKLLGLPISRERFGTWRNPEMIVRSVVKTRKGLELEFENTPPAIYQDLRRLALVRRELANSDATKVEIVLPRNSFKTTELKVRAPSAVEGFVSIGDTFRFSDKG